MPSNDATSTSGRWKLHLSPSTTPATLLNKPHKKSNHQAAPHIAANRRLCGRDQLSESAFSKRCQELPALLMSNGDRFCSDTSKNSSK